MNDLAMVFVIDMAAEAKMLGQIPHMCVLGVINRVHPLDSSRLGDGNQVVHENHPQSTSLPFVGDRHCALAGIPGGIGAVTAHPDQLLTGLVRNDRSKRDLVSVVQYRQLRQQLFAGRPNLAQEPEAAGLWRQALNERALDIPVRRCDGSN